MKNIFFGFLIITVFICFSINLLLGCASTAQVSGLINLDEAISEITTEIENRIQSGASVAILKIDSPLPLLTNFLNSEMEKNLVSSGKLTMVARGEVLERINEEHLYQMSGMVSDESIAGIGHMLGATVVIIGDFSRYANFSTFFVRAIEVRTARVLASHSAKLNNRDPILAGIISPLDTSNIVVMNEAALEHYNLGREYLWAGIPDMAIKEFNSAISKNRNFANAYLFRGWSYWHIREISGNLNKAINDYTAAIRIDPTLAEAFMQRGDAYAYRAEIPRERRNGDYENAVADYTAALRLSKNDVLSSFILAGRGIAYFYMVSLPDNYSRAINDFETALRLAPNRHEYIIPLWKSAHEEMGTWYTNPLIQFEVDFRNDGLGILTYYGYRPHEFEFQNAFAEYIHAFEENEMTQGNIPSIIPGYFLYQIESPEVLITSSLALGNNPDLDERIKNEMRRNNITVCDTLYRNEYGGFTYVVNYSFNNFNTFGSVIMDSINAPITTVTSTNMIRIPGGTFTMGSPANEAGRYDNENQRRVTVSAFYMGKYEVTQREYQEVMGYNPSHFTGNLRCPVEQVTWYDAIEYCNKLSQKEGLTPVYTITGRTPASGYPITEATVTANFNNNGYRLPTEVEWEYACRAGTTTTYNTGAGISDNTGWYNANSNGSTQPVGQKPANAFGLYDMHGNIWEWCWDWKEVTMRNFVNQRSIVFRYPVIRGGAWNSSAEDIRSARWGTDSPETMSRIIGFRLVRS